MEDTIFEKCMNCDRTLDGRPNRKFCTATCKSRYHNKSAWESRMIDKAIRDITGEAHDILWENRNILVQLLEEGKEQLTKEELEELGFEFNYLTNFSKKDNKTNLLHIYDCGYYFLDNENVKIF